MKRIVSVFLSVVFIIALTPQALAGELLPETVIAYYDHEEDFTGDRGDWIISSRDADDVAKRETVGGGNALHLSTGSAGSFNVQLQIPRLVRLKPDCAVLQFKIRNEDYGVKSMGTADQGPNPNWRFFTYFNIDESGNLNVGGNNIYSLPLHEFHELAFVTNFVEKKFDAYVDGVYKTTVSFDARYGYLAELGITLTGASGASSIYIDDFAIYVSDTLLPDESIKTKYAEMRTTTSECPMRDELDEYARDYSLFAVDAKYGCFAGERREMMYRPYREENAVMIPARFVAEGMGAEVNGTEDRLSVKAGSREIILTEDGMTVNGVPKTLSCAAKKKDGVLYVPYREFFEEFGDVYYNDEFGFIAVGDGDYANVLTERVDAREMYYYLVYSKPTAEDILRDYGNASAGVHPRVYYTPQSVAALQELVKTDADMKTWYNKQLSSANSYLNAPPIQIYITDNELNTNFYPSPIMFTDLAFAYMMTKDKSYGDALWKAIEGFIALPDLNHRRSFLNGSGAGNAVSMAYDWAYDYFTPEQREKITTALKNKLVDPWVRAHQGLGAFGCSGYTYKVADNINCVMSSQFLSAVSVLFDTDPTYYSKAFAACFRQLEYFLPLYAPDGGYFEGPHYWEYATSNLVNLFDMAECALGTSYGYYDVFNVKDTGAFPLYMSGAKYSFNFADAERTSLYTGMTVAYYFAVKNNDPDFAAVVLDNMRSSGFDVGSRWYDPSFASANAGEFPLDAYFRGVEAGSMRERWNDTDACYLGYRGGTNVGGHDQLDKGTFVFDALGERWAEDLGRDDYNYPGYFDTRTRYNYYTNRGEGHNLLLVNPEGRYADQTLDATCKRVDSGSAEGGAYAVLDTTAMYEASEVSNAKRGFMLTDYRKTAVIRDELTLTSNDNSIYWFMHTKATIETNGKTAVLTLGNKKCVLTLECSEPSAVFEAMEPEHMTASFKPEDRYYTDLTDAYNKLAVKLRAGSGDFYINVSMRAFDAYTETVGAPAYINKPLERWEVFDNTTATPETAGIDALHTGDNVSAENNRISIFLGNRQAAQMKDISVLISENNKELRRGIDFAINNMNPYEAEIEFFRPLCRDCTYLIMVEGEYRAYYSFKTARGEGENLAPRITLYPQESGYAGNLTVLAGTYDDFDSIKNVAYYLDGNPLLTSDEYPYSVHLWKLTAGEHSIRAIITDTAGNIGMSNILHFTAEESTVKAGVFTSISDGHIFPYNENISVSAYAVDIRGEEISDVSLYIDGVYSGLNSVNTAVSVGKHTLKAVASDSENNEYVREVKFEYRPEYIRGSSLVSFDFNGDSPDVPQYQDLLPIATGVETVDEAHGGCFYFTSAEGLAEGQKPFFEIWHSSYYRGVAGASFDFMAEDVSAQNILLPSTRASGYNYTPSVKIIDGVVTDTTTNETFGSIESGRWYRVEMAYDIEDYKLYINIGNIQIIKELPPSDATFIRTLRFSAYEAVNKAAGKKLYIDNIKDYIWQQKYATVKSITAVSHGGTETSESRIPHDTEYFVINLTSPVPATAQLKGKLLLYKDNVPINAALTFYGETGSNNNRTYYKAVKLTPSEPLELGHIYTIKMCVGFPSYPANDTIYSTSTVYSLCEYSFEKTVSQDGFSLEEVALYDGDAAVASLSDVTDSTVKLHIKATNTDTESKRVYAVCASYNENRLLDISVLNTTVGGNAVGEVIETEEISTVGATSVKGFLWHKTGMPYRTPVVID